MPDKEKLVNELNDCLENQHISFIDGVGNVYAVSEEIIKNIITLLKEQEPILLENQHKPYGISTNANSPWISRCPRCGKKVEGKQTRFCKYCGQEVKWE